MVDKLPFPQLVSFFPGFLKPSTVDGSEPPPTVDGSEIPRPTTNGDVEIP